MARLPPRPCGLLLMNSANSQRENPPLSPSELLRSSNWLLVYWLIREKGQRSDRLSVLPQSTNYPANQFLQRSCHRRVGEDFTSLFLPSITPSPRRGPWLAKTGCGAAVEEIFMKKAKTDQLRPEYIREDFGKGVRGKYYEAYRKEKKRGQIFNL